MLPIFLPLALSTFLILGDTSAVRRGPDLLYQWSGLMKNVGSVEIYGCVSGQGDRTVVKGRFGGGALSVELGSDSQTWTTRVRTDGNEAEIEDIALGMILRRKISELKISIAEEEIFLEYFLLCENRFFLAKTPAEYRGGSMQSKPAKYTEYGLVKNR